jgi:DNA-binding beta-propeller fold protein YncE
MFPATLDLTPDGLYAFAVNFNLYGEHVPSTVSVIYTPDNVEVARVETCTMPHGSRLDRSGLHQYSVCMMDDQLVELDTRTFDVARRFSVAKGQEGPVQQNAMADDGMDHGEHDVGAMKTPTCSPTWAQPGTNGEFVYVACNKADEILEISADDWVVTRRFATGRAPYNLAVTPDGRLLVATLKAGKAVEFIDLTTGERRATTETSTTVVHGVVVSPDSRYAFVSVEGVGAEPGKVDVFDLRTFERVASAEVGQQASGIAFWRSEPSGR